MRISREYFQKDSQFYFSTKSPKTIKNIQSKKTACYITVKIENTDFFFGYEFSIGNSMQDQEPTEPENVRPQNIQALHFSNASLIINFSCIPVLS